MFITFLAMMVTPCAAPNGILSIAVGGVLVAELLKQGYIPLLNSAVKTSASKVMQETLNVASKETSMAAAKETGKQLAGNAESKFKFALLYLPIPMHLLLSEGQ